MQNVKRSLLTHTLGCANGTEHLRNRSKNRWLPLDVYIWESNIITPCAACDKESVASKLTGWKTSDASSCTSCALGGNSHKLVCYIIVHAFVSCAYWNRRRGQVAHGNQPCDSPGIGLWLIVVNRHFWTAAACLSTRQTRLLLARLD